jgi:hypothetical protein
VCVFANPAWLLPVSLMQPTSRHYPRACRTCFEFKPYSTGPFTALLRSRSLCIVTDKPRRILRARCPGCDRHPNRTNKCFIRSTSRIRIISPHGALPALGYCLLTEHKLHKRSAPPGGQPNFLLSDYISSWSTNCTSGVRREGHSGTKSPFDAFKQTFRYVTVPFPLKWKRAFDSKRNVHLAWPSVSVRPWQ